MVVISITPQLASHLILVFLSKKVFILFIYIYIYCFNKNLYFACIEFTFVRNFANSTKNKQKKAKQYEKEERIKKYVNKTCKQIARAFIQCRLGQISGDLIHQFLTQDMINKALKDAAAVQPTIKGNYGDYIRDLTKTSKITGFFLCIFSFVCYFFFYYFVR